MIRRKNSTDKVQIIKKIPYGKLIEHCKNYYQVSCNRNIITKLKNDILYNAKYINFILIKKNIKVIDQIIDQRNKARYLILNNKNLIPLYPSGIINNIPFTNNVGKYLLGVKKMIDNLLYVDKIISELDYRPIGILYNKIKKNTILLDLY